MVYCTELKFLSSVIKYYTRYDVLYTDLKFLSSVINIIFDMVYCILLESSSAR